MKFNMSFTEKGLALRSKAEAGTQLVFTRAAFGDGTPSGEEEVTALVNEIASSDIRSVSTDGNYAKISCVFSNENLTDAFYWKEVGVFATDPDEGEILYAYASSGDEGDYIPSSEEMILERDIHFDILIGSAENVSAVIDSSAVYVTMREFNDLSDAVSVIQGDYLKSGNIVNNLTTTASGYALDARQGRSLSTTISSNRNYMDRVAYALSWITFTDWVSPSVYAGAQGNYSWNLNDNGTLKNYVNEHGEGKYAVYMYANGGGMPCLYNTIWCAEIDVFMEEVSGLTFYGISSYTTKYGSIPSGMNMANTDYGAHTQYASGQGILYSSNKSYFSQYVLKVKKI